MIYKILIVCNDINDEKLFQKCLEKIEPNIECDFAFSDTEAFNKLKSNEMDACIVYSDSSLTKSIEILTRLKRNYPKVLRILLTNSVEMKLPLRAFNLLHQYHNLIYENLFIEKIKPALILKNLIKNDKFIAKLNGQDGIPALPEKYFKIQQEIFSPEVSVHRIVNLISKDIAITTKIFQIVNSAYFGIPAKITDIYQAINILGLNVLKSIIIYTKVFLHLEKVKELKEIIESIWNHSIVVSNMSQKIIQYFTGIRNLAEQAYIAGILHDIGKIILLNVESDYKNVLKLFNNNAVIDDNAVKNIYGATHSEIGAYALALWGFPRSVVDAVLLHHSTPAYNDLSIATVIQISHKIANIEGIDSILYDAFNSSEELFEFLNSIDSFDENKNVEKNFNE